MNKYIEVINQALSEYRVRLFIYIVFIIGLLYSNIDLRVTIVAAIATSALEQNYRLSSIDKKMDQIDNKQTISLNDIDGKQTINLNNKIAGIVKKIDQIKENGCLLPDGTAWHKGAEMIDGLEKGEMILASNLVSWNKDNVKDYITANKKALRKGVIIRRLYANTPQNEKLAKDQLKWIKGVESEQQFERLMYDRKQPMLDYILAIDKNNIPKWAVLWIYSPKWASSIVHGFIIKDKKILEGLHTDFNSKWTGCDYTTPAPTTE